MYVRNGQIIAKDANARERSDFAVVCTALNIVQLVVSATSQTEMGGRSIVTLHSGAIFAPSPERRGFCELKCASPAHVRRRHLEKESAPKRPR